MGIPSGQLAAASLSGQLTGMATSAIGSYFSAGAQKATLQGQADIADINAQIAELGAQQELLKGQRQVGAITLKAGQLKASQRAAMAANGIDLGVGSAAEIQASTDLMKEIDANTLTANAVRDAWGFRTQAVNFQNEALMKRAGAAGISPGMAAGTSLLGSAGTVASNWYNLNKSGALKGTIFELKD